MASSTNDRYNAAAAGYANSAAQYTGNQGYKNSVEQSRGVAREQTAEAVDAGLSNGANITNRVNSMAQGGAENQTANSTNSAIDKGSQMNAAQNAEARKYAAQQAQNAAAGAQSQATTAARAAGMNKAQAAMMGSQQNANAYQNAYGNAYSQQLGNAASNQNTQLANYNSAYENQANRANANINNQQGMANTNMGNQQGLAIQSGTSNVSAHGTAMGAGQQEGQNEYNRKWGNWGFGLGLLTSDERLKHYQECSKKVVYRTPSKIQTLKYVHKGE